MTIVAGIDLEGNESAAGFRLQRLELLNWHPFDDGIRVLELNARTTLLTGDVAASQSGLVEAIAALLAPSEREPSENSRGYSVILGVFRDPADDATISLAQLRWGSPEGTEPGRLYVCAERALSIAAHLDPSGLGRAELVADLCRLDAEVDAAIPRYSAWIRRRFGLRSARALKVFRRIGSVRSPGGIDAVVRRDVLDAAEIAPRLRALSAAFAQSEHARHALLAAKDAEALLASIVAACDRRESLAQEVAALRTCAAALPAYAARLKLELLDERLGCMHNIREQLGIQIKRLEARREERRAQVDELRVALARSGGDRLARLSAEIRRSVGLRDARRVRAERYGDLLRRVGEEAPTDEAAFHAQRRRLQHLRGEARERDAYLAHALPEYDERLREVRQELGTLPAALERIKAPDATHEPTLAALETRVHTLELRVAAITQLIGKDQAQRKSLAERLEVLARLEEFLDFDELDWSSTAATIAELVAERARLESGSDALKPLSQRLQQLEHEIARTERELDTAKDRRAKIEQRMHEAQVLRGQTESLIARSDLASEEPGQSTVAARLGSLQSEALHGREASLDICDQVEAESADLLRGKLDAEEDKLRRVQDSVVRTMFRFSAEFPREGAGLGARLDASDAYRDRLAHLRQATLPSLEAAFERQIALDMRDEFASFEAALARDRALLLERLRQINHALVRIDPASPDSIALEAAPSADADVREFRAALRACADRRAAEPQGACDAEATFDRMRALVDRLRIRAGSSEQDRRWRAQVADVRNWFVYRAVARERKAPAEHGPAVAGIHDEMAACTVFAANLVHEFGLESREVLARSLRFAVLGMGITCGSDDALRHALDLYRRLGVQLLVVAPPSKTPVIEPFVAGVGFVHATSGGTATLHAVSIDVQR